jgi:tetratricopeptide (TPR) repeat protein
LGLAYAQKGQFDLAIEQFTLAGDEISANQKLSQIFYRKGKHELARKYRHKAVQLEAAINNERSIEEEKKSVPKNIPQDNIPQNESLKRTSEKQKIKSIQYLVEPEIEVSNGNGVNRMATRMGNYLRNKGLNVTLLTNADHFGYEETKIYYSEPHLHDAYKVAQQIPGWQDMEKVNEFSRQNIKIKVLIGKDLISYDRLFSETMKEVSFHPS